MAENDSYWRSRRGALPALMISIALLAGVVVIVVRQMPDVGLYGVQTKFPTVRDNSEIEISLERTVCYGFCPDYSVKITGAGDVLYEGRECVSEQGTRHTRIDRATVKKLLDKFRNANFFSLRDDYRAGVTDNPTYTISLRIDGNTKSVVDYVGVSAGMPLAVTGLEEAVDKAAHTNTWIFGNGRKCFGNPVDDSWRRQHT